MAALKVPPESVNLSTGSQASFKTMPSTFSEQFLAVLNLKYLRRIRCSENDRLTTSPQHPIPAFCSDHTRTRMSNGSTEDAVHYRLPDSNRAKSRYPRAHARGTC